MIEQKYFPAYSPDNPILEKRRASLMLTYEQILTIASVLAEMQRVNNKFLSPIHLTDTEISRTTAIHNACINCALSMEEHERSNEK